MKMYPASHDFGVYLWEFQGKWCFAIPELGFAAERDSAEEAKESARNFSMWARKEGNGLVFRALVPVDPDGF